MSVTKKLTIALLLVGAMVSGHATKLLKLASSALITTAYADDGSDEDDINRSGTTCG